MRQNYRIKEKSKSKPIFRAIESLTKIENFEVYKVLRQRNVFILHDLVFEDFIIVEYAGIEVDFDEFHDYIKDLRAMLIWGIN
ncbi:MAG TPA: hypothetical protein VF581_11495 [Flavobacterium sp.]|jgi:hypothetical protein